MYFGHFGVALHCSYSEGTQAYFAWNRCADMWTVEIAAFACLTGCAGSVEIAACVVVQTLLKGVEACWVSVVDVVACFVIVEVWLVVRS